MDWLDLFTKLNEEDFYKNLLAFIEEEYKKDICYPPKELIFNAFTLTPFESVKVVIIGQDPYHEVNQAMGLSFSVNNGIKLPPSLRNIFIEIENEYNYLLNYQNGDLTYLAKQGVLLLNSILTVKEHFPLSHNIKEYKMLFKEVILFLNNSDKPIVFLLWGSEAKKAKKYINNPKHLILEANHPSPLSANRGGWFGCNHFIKANEFLASNNRKIIEWDNTLL